MTPETVCCCPFRFEDESLVVGSDNLATSLYRNGGQDIVPHQPFSSTFSKDCCLARVMALPTAACIHACSTWVYNSSFQLLSPTQHISEVTSELPVGRSRFQLRPKLNVLSLCPSPRLPPCCFLFPEVHVQHFLKTLAYEHPSLGSALRVPTYDN